MPSFFITGTDTGVGKTAITAGLTAILRAQGIDAVPMKPVQTGGIPAGDSILSEDVQFYQQVTTLPVTHSEMNPCCLVPALSPNVAARLSGTTIDLDQIEDAYRRLAAHHQVVLVEGAGGICVPLQDNLTFADLAKRLNLTLLVVARPGLGTINHTVLTVRYAQQCGLAITGIIIKGYCEETATMAEKTNPEVIHALTGIPILGIVPWISGLNVESGNTGNLMEVIGSSVKWQALIEHSSQVKASGN